MSILYIFVGFQKNADVCAGATWKEVVDAHAVLFFGVNGER